MSCKFASIRKNTEESCPFGLPIPFGCKCAGKNTNQMAPLNIMGDQSSDEEKEMISAANTKLLAWNILQNPEKPSQCPYAGMLLEKNDAVECNYEDSAPGQGPAQALQAAPFYGKVFNGGMLGGLLTSPPGYYSDYNVSRNSYFGTLSLQGEDRKEMIKVLAEKINK
jgi:hypothetical protein